MWFHTIAIPVKNSNGKTEYLLVISIDITRQTKAKKELSEHKERLDLAVQVSTDLIYEWNLNSDQLQWFGDIDKTLGYKKGAIPCTLRGWLNLIHPEDRPNLNEAVSFHRKSTKPIYVEYRIKNRIDEKIEQMEFMGRVNIKHHKRYLDLQKENTALKKGLEKYEDID